MSIGGELTITISLRYPVPSGDSLYENASHAHPDGPCDGDANNNPHGGMRNFKRNHLCQVAAPRIEMTFLIG
jgi:hypothetical protein